MTKAAFLDILHHVSSISNQEVNELEKLALTFPYCQSAHLLLAKAAYDQGSMLSNQRLRRAAVCATNRQLLKKLIYTAGTDIVLEPIPVVTEAGEPITEPALATEIVPEPVTTEPTLVIPEEALLVDEITDSETLELLDDPLIEEVEEVAATQARTVEVEIVTEAELRETTSEELKLLSELDALFSVEHLVPSVAFQNPVTEFILANETEAGSTPATSFAEENIIETISPAIQEEDNLITVPDTSEESEYGLTEQHQLLADVDSTETLARFDEYLFTPEKEIDIVNANSASQVYQEEILYKVFDANELGYWMDSSRLGETLIIKNELATAQPVYFRPELFLEFSKNNELASYQPPTQKALTRQLDIIDHFLKSNPKLRSMAHVKIKSESQEDLSSKSTKIKKNLASENLANILVQQGKIKKAIKIYEHLTLKIPEKKAYFASQIEKLQNIT